LIIGDGVQIDSILDVIALLGSFYVGRIRIRTPTGGLFEAIFMADDAFDLDLSGHVKAIEYVGNTLVDLSGTAQAGTVIHQAGM